MAFRMRFLFQPTCSACFLSDSFCFTADCGLKLQGLVVVSCVQFSAAAWAGPPDSSARGIFPARMLEWGAISYSRGSSWPRDRACISCISCTGGPIFTTSATCETRVLTEQSKVEIYVECRGHEPTCVSQMPSFSDPPKTLLNSILILWKGILWFCYFFLIEPMSFLRD